MPPKRRPRTDMLPDPTNEPGKSLSSSQTLEAPDAKKTKDTEVSSSTTSQAHAVISSKPGLSDIIDDGELGNVKIVASVQPVPKPVSTGPKSAEELNPDLVDDGRPICSYDDECYRKNPTHFKQFRHPRLLENKRVEAEAVNGTAAASVPVHAPAALLASPSTLKRAGSSGVGLSASQMASTSVRPEIELYKTAMKSVLSGQSKVSSEGRKLLKMFRQAHAVTEQEHDQLLGQFGWTPDEYEDGEKNQAAFELDEERDFLRANGPDAFKIFTLFKHQKRNHQQESVWARATSKFYQTMSKAQANFVIKSIGLVVNAKVNAVYEARKAQMFANSGGKAPINEEWGFHGTSEASIQGISSTGFKMPDELKKQQPGKTKKTGKVTFLDDGYFGAGLYFSLYSDYALYYSEERGSHQILLCKVLTGKSYKCPDRMDGAGLTKGYDSHYSPLGNEVIVFRGDQVLPRYIITFEQREAQDPEQED